MIDLRSASVRCKVAAIIGMFYIIASIVFAAFPGMLVATIDWKSESAQYTIASLDLVIGLALIWAAPSSRSPVGLNIFGAIALLGSMFYFLAPVEFVAVYLHWWLVEQSALTRILSVLFGLPFGAFILFAALSSPTPLKDSASHSP